MSGVKNDKKRSPVLLAIIVLVLIVAGINGALLVPRAGWTTSDVTTGQAPGYPDLQPRRYDVPPAMAAAFAAQFATKKLGWRIASTNMTSGVVEIAIPVWLGLAAADLTVTALPDGKYARVVLRSRSRVGGADLGANARHIRALQAAMDDKLPLAP